MPVAFSARLNPNKSIKNLKIMEKQKDTIAKSANVVDFLGYKIDKGDALSDLPIYTVKVGGVALAISPGDLFEKYRAQKLDSFEQFDCLEQWAENEEEEQYYRALEKWAHDGKPTGIKSDEEFYRLQKELWDNIDCELE